ncbi:MAG: hypothetical protein KF817_10650 [Phycisphaeraceae bacterium]|nr:hypothetical protein [Phycisphaeraceae bacterium]
MTSTEHASEAGTIEPPRLRPGQGRSAGTSTQRVVLFVIRSAYLLVLVAIALLPFVGEITGRSGDSPFASVDNTGALVTAFLSTLLFGLMIILVDLLTPNKRLASVFGVYFGIAAGLLGALAFGALIDLIFDSWELLTRDFTAYRLLLKTGIAVSLCYLAVSIVLTTKDDFRLVIPYIEFAKQVRGVRPILLDSSALIDGRISAIADTGFLDAPLVVPHAVIEELQALSDSGDRLKRARGRRGLDVVQALQGNPHVDFTIEGRREGDEAAQVDQLLLRRAAEEKFRILTTDFNLIKVGRIRGVGVIGLNDLAAAMRAPVQAGDILDIEITRPGESDDQGVGFLPDGTMVVVNGAGRMIGQTVRFAVSNVLQTAAGRMVFGRMDPEDAPSRDTDSQDAGSAGSMARAALNQPRGPRRNPRR